MPEEERKSVRPRWVPLWLWQLRWWILGTLFILVWWLVPPLLYRHTGAGKDAKLEAITATRTALLAGLIGVGAVLTFWLNSKVYRITARTLEIAEQGHITERYTKAIQQLGDTSLAVRLGGIYALERIAIDSERDHPTVVEVLSAFVREQSKKCDPSAEERTTQEATETDTPTPPGLGSSRLATDIQAALTVLGRLPRLPGPRADLSEAQLSGARLEREANLSGARLEKANLSGAWLERVNLSSAWLDRADLSSARLSRADLFRARLKGADLSGARLNRISLRGAWLPEANLSGAQLSRANLTGAHLTGAQFDGADLTGAQFDGADLTGAQFDGADLRETIALTQERLNSAGGDANTRLPDGLQRPDGWASDHKPPPTNF